MPRRTGYVTTVQVAADIIGVTERTIYNWINEGLIEAHKLPGGRGWRIPLKAVAKIIGMSEKDLLEEFCEREEE